MHTYSRITTSVAIFYMHLAALTSLLCGNCFVWLLLCITSSFCDGQLDSRWLFKPSCVQSRATQSPCCYSVHFRSCCGFHLVATYPARSQPSWSRLPLWSTADHRRLRCRGGMYYTCAGFLLPQYCLLRVPMISRVLLVWQWPAGSVERIGAATRVAI